MNMRPLRCMMLLAWFAGCGADKSEGAKTRPPPGKDALAHFCSHMATGPSATTTALPASQRQAGWLAEMTDAAKVANIPGWSSFRASLIEIEPQDKQAWLELGVKRHGLQSECAVILKNHR